MILTLREDEVEDFLTVFVALYNALADQLEKSPTLVCTLGPEAHKAMNVITERLKARPKRRPDDAD